MDDNIEEDISTIKSNLTKIKETITDLDSKVPQPPQEYDKLLEDYGNKKTNKRN